jgi:hypothetical protein
VRAVERSGLSLLAASTALVRRWSLMRASFLFVLVGALVGCANAGLPRIDVGPRDGSAHDGAPADAGPGNDAAPTLDDAAQPDAATPDGSAPPVDASGPGMDAGPTTGTRAYLDRCTSPSDCASGLCEADTGGTSFCSKTCSTHAQCASEQVCDGGICVPDDTGTPCTSASTCTLDLCVGSAATGLGRCTRGCSSAADCPAGAACSDAGGTHVCVEIERTCSSAAQCATGLCLGPTYGCTAACRSAADCPARLVGIGLSPYTCELVSGTFVCVPPVDEVAGSDAMGSACAATGTNTCRSSACDTSAPLGPICVQACSSTGGCPPGLGCFPLLDSDTGAFEALVCELAGTHDLTQSCATSRDCSSGMCAPGGHCTRLCPDGYCPTGQSCRTDPSSGVALCLPL